MKQTLDTIVAFMRNEPINKIVLSLLIIVVGIIIHRLLLRFTERQVSDSKTRYRWKKTISYSLTIVLLLIVARVWFTRYQFSHNFHRFDECRSGNCPEGYVV